MGWQWQKQWGFTWLDANLTFPLLYPLGNRRNVELFSLESAFRLKLARMLSFTKADTGNMGITKHRPVK